MEGRNHSQSSSSSFIDELLGSKDSSSSSRGFESLFDPPEKVLRRNSFHFEEKRQDSASEAWNKKPKPQDGFKNNEGQGYSAWNQDRNFIYHDKHAQPCHLSSSVYYGGPDVFPFPPSSEVSGLSSTYNKDGKDDSGAASRGDWWRGSLYY